MLGRNRFSISTSNSKHKRNPTPSSTSKYAPSKGAYVTHLLDPITSYGNLEDKDQEENSLGALVNYQLGDEETGKVAGFPSPSNLPSTKEPGTSKWEKLKKHQHPRAYEEPFSRKSNNGRRTEDEHESHHRPQTSNRSFQPPLRRLLVQTNAISSPLQDQSQNLSVSQSFAQDGSRLEASSRIAPAAVRKSSSSPISLRSVLASQNPDWFVSSLGSPEVDGNEQHTMSPRKSNRQDERQPPTVTFKPHAQRRVVSAPSQQGMKKQAIHSGTCIPRRPSGFPSNLSGRRVVEKRSTSAPVLQNQPIQRTFNDPSTSRTRPELIASAFGIPFPSEFQTRRGDLRILIDGSMIFSLSNASHQDLVRLWISPNGLKIRNICALPADEPNPNSTSLTFDSPSRLSSIPRDFLPEDLVIAYRHCSRWLDSIRSKIVLGSFQVPDLRGNLGSSTDVQNQSSNVIVLSNGKEPDYIKTFLQTIRSDDGCLYEVETKVQVSRRKGVAVLEERTFKLGGANEPTGKGSREGGYSKRVMPLVPRDFSLSSSSSSTSPVESPLTLSDRELRIQSNSLIFNSLDDSQRSEVLNALNCGIIVDSLWKAWQDGVSRNLKLGEKHQHESVERDQDRIVEKGQSHEMTPPVSKSRSRRLSHLEKVWAKKSLG